MRVIGGGRTGERSEVGVGRRHWVRVRVRARARARASLAYTPAARANAGMSKPTGARVVVSLTRP